MTREEAIEILQGAIKKPNTKDGYLGQAIDMAIKALNQQKEGHNCNEDYADCDQFVCSECGIELQDWYRVERDEDDGDIIYHDYVFRFCPNCGAKMESEA